LRPPPKPEDSTATVADAVNPISFLTAGEDECRAWPIRRGTTALKAAGKIHSDIERGLTAERVLAHARLPDAQRDEKVSFRL